MTRIRLLKIDNQVDCLEVTRTDGSVFKTTAEGLAEDTILRFAVEDELDLEGPFRALAKSCNSTRAASPDGALNVDAIAKAFKDHPVGTPPSVFLQTIMMICQHMGIKRIPITVMQTEAIRSKVNALMGDWNALKPGETLEMLLR